VNDQIQIRWANADEAVDILAFIQAMGFNPRDKVTWDGLEMVAMSAWQGGKLIGAIPLEPRPLKIAPDKTVWAMHETVVAVHPEHRGNGIGSKIQDEIFRTLPTEIELLSVFREEPDSPAYRWYIKNNFRPAMQIDSWFYEGSPEFRMPRVDLFVPSDARLPWDSLAQIWRKARQACSGMVDQAQRSLQAWLKIHPYRARYDFMIANERERFACPAGYAVLGTGDMHSDHKRCDILDMVSTGGSADVRRLLEETIPFVIKSGCASIRWPLAQNDPNIVVAQELGFKKKWGFDMLIRPLIPHCRTWNLETYAGIDYI